MYVILLLIGFVANGASAFTTAFARRWGERNGRRVSVVLRNILGIPVWSAGFVLAVQRPSPPLFGGGGLCAAVAGWLLVLGGAALVIGGLVALGRRAWAPSVQDTLVTHGLYAHVRHPVHSGVLLEFAGLALLRPTLPVVVACVLGCGWALVQTGLEERDLLRRIPAYREYMGRVPRWGRRCSCRRRGHR